MIIDCHGHFTTVPAAHSDWRRAQLESHSAGKRAPSYPGIADDEIREVLEFNQLRLMRERGTDLTVFSPRASAMGHHLGDLDTSVAWAQVNNDLIARVIEIYPTSFAGVCQLPQAAGEPVDAAVAELRRCVEQLNFVGLNLNPDPSGGHWISAPLHDAYWFPLYEAMSELGVPAMVHVSASDNPALHSTGAHYLNADTTAFMQLVQGDVFDRFPALRLIIPHGGGAVPYHWGRFRGLADMLGKPPLDDHVMNNVFFDTCVYHQPGIDLLTSVVQVENLLFGSEMVGAVRGVDPLTGHHFDDTKRYIDAAALSEGQRHCIYETNALTAYPKLRCSEER